MSLTPRYSRGGRLRSPCWGEQALAVNGFFRLLHMLCSEWMKESRFIMFENIGLSLESCTPTEGETSWMHAMIMMDSAISH